MFKALSIAAVACAALTSSVVAQAQDRPNVLVVYTDDQRFDAAGFTGNTAIYTPNLDRVARQGVIFDNCFVITSICAPSRANVMTGQYPARHGVTDFFKVLDDEQMNATFTSRLREAGYFTGFIGKWGIGDSIDATHRAAGFFDYWGGASHQTNFFHEPDCKYVNYDGVSKPIDDVCDCPADSRGVKGPHVRIGKENLTDPLHVDMDITPMKAVDFLDARASANGDDPFCLVVMFKAPHSPFGDWDESQADRYKDLFLPHPPTATLPIAKAEPQVVQKSLGGNGGRRLAGSQVEMQKHLQNYYRLVSSMDAGFGAIIDELEARGELDNTVILFTSDNGFMHGDHGSIEKWLMYEPSLRVPGFMTDMRSPRSNGPLRVPQLVTTPDFTATALDVAGLDVPDDVSGASLADLADGETSAWRTDFYYQQPYTHGGALPYITGVRGERYTYTVYESESPVVEQLFDLHADPMQLNNLIDDPAASEVVAEMRRRHAELKNQVD